MSSKKEKKLTTSLEQEQEHVRIDLAAMFRLTAHFGWDDTVWNHITARVPGSIIIFTCIDSVCITARLARQI